MKIIEENNRIKCSKCKSILEYTEEDINKIDFESLGIELCHSDGTYIRTNADITAKCIGMDIQELNQRDIPVDLCAQFSTIKCPVCGEILCVDNVQSIYPYCNSIKRQILHKISNNY